MLLELATLGAITCGLPWARKFPLFSCPRKGKQKGGAPIVAGGLKSVWVVQVVQTLYIFTYSKQSQRKIS